MNKLKYWIRGHVVLLALLLWLTYHAVEAYYYDNPLTAVIGWYDTYSDGSRGPSSIHSWTSSTRARMGVAVQSDARPWTHGYPPEDVVRWCVWNQITQACNDG